MRFDEELDFDADGWQHLNDGLLGSEEQPVNQGQSWALRLCGPVRYPDSGAT